MFTRILSSFALAGLLAVPAAAQAPVEIAMETDARIVLQADSRIWVEGTSTVRDYSCDATTIDAVIDPASSSNADGSELHEAVRAGVLDIPTSALDCGNGKMNQHMLKALKAKEFPSIRYRMTSHEWNGGSDQADVTMEGELTIAGEQRPVTITGKGIPQANGTVRVQGTTEIDMRKWSVKPPSLFLGTLNVAPRVTVHFDVALKQVGI